MPRTLSDTLLSRLSQLLAAQTGLNFPRERWDDLERGLHAAACESGDASVENYAHRILSAPLTHQQTELLASNLTVGETHFFRDANIYAALEHTVLPQLIAARRSEGRRLRIWSAGCCTGEEPYSIAILLDRLLPDIAQWNITLLATDINPRFLRKGMAGVYGEWSFRGTPPWVRESYFRQAGQGRYEILPRIRKRVTFSCLNLADEIYPSLSNNTNAMDLIVCSNVLIYFTPAWAGKVAANLHRALVDGGWLVVSSTEASAALFAQFVPVNVSDAVLYRKSIAGVIAPVQAGQSGMAHEAQEAQVVPAHFPAPGAAAPERQAIPAPPRDPCTRARLCANRGELFEAAEWCSKAITADKTNPQCHYLFATVLLELGQVDAAEQALKRAIYLDPDFVLAYFSLGNLRLSQGRFAQAEHYFWSAQTLLRKYPLHEIIPESDGLAAGRLSEIIGSVLASMPQETALRA